MNIIVEMPLKRLSKNTYIKKLQGLYNRQFRMKHLSIFIYNHKHLAYKHKSSKIVIFLLSLKYHNIYNNS